MTLPKWISDLAASRDSRAEDHASVIINGDTIAIIKEMKSSHLAGSEQEARLIAALTLAWDALEAITAPHGEGEWGWLGPAYENASRKTLAAIAHMGE